MIVLLFCRERRRLLSAVCSIEEGSLIGEEVVSLLD
jgi:hypothetical protein